MGNSEENLGGQHPVVESTSGTDLTAAPTVRFWPLLAIVACWSLVLLAALQSYQEPEVQPASVAEDRFSADRAWKHLAGVFSEDQAHPAGSDANARVADRIEARLTEWGYPVERQRGTRKVNPSVRDRSPDQSDIALTNLLAGDFQVDGRQKLLIVAHYDSVPFGPGASDNGVSVAAVLEVARMLKQYPSQCPVCFLFTDGEELGLLGAKLFAEEHSLISEVAAVINLDARGTSGPSLMFETQGPTAELLPVFAAGVPRPFASSLFFEIYKRLPRDTDFSVFKRHGVRGYNLAFIGDVGNYHTPADSLDQASRGSLQSHGQQLWGLVRAIDGHPLAEPWFQSRASAVAAQDELIYFDLFGRVMPRWSAGLSSWLASIGWLVALALVVVAIRRQPSWAWGTSALRLLLLVAATGILTGGLLAGLRSNTLLAHPWPSHGGWVLLATWLCGAALVVATARWWIGGAPASTTVWLGFVWWTLAWALAWLAPGVSYLFLLPAAGWLLVGLLQRALGRGSRSNVHPLPPLALAGLAGLLWIPLEPLFYDAVGFRMATFNGVRCALVLTTLLPLATTLSDRQRLWNALLLAAAGVGLVVWVLLVG